MSEGPLPQPDLATSEPGTPLADREDTGQNNSPQEHGPPAPAFLDIFSNYNTILPDVRTIFTVFCDLLAEELTSLRLQNSIVESTPFELSVSHSMITTPSIYRKIRKAPEQGSVNTSYTLLEVPRNSQVIH